ncbi:MAG: hypothetical protein H6Q68_3382 [Firmicutes bacterium]|nr:hypothetical protein [Bacillota bacterium]
MKFDIHESVKQGDTRCRLGYILIRNVKIQGTPPSLAQKFFQLQTSIAAVYNIDALANVPRIAGVGSLYNHKGFDASRYNLASEELVRRVIDNKDSYYVNSAVTVINYCSINFLLPIGLYDLDQINGDIMYNIPLEDNYMDIRGDVMATDCKPFLSDSNGVFGNSNAEARRTAVTLSTNNLLAVVYADEKVAAEELMRILNFTSEMIIRYNGGTVEKQEIIE